MTQLTQERFEQVLHQKIKGLASKADLREAVRPLATKQDVRDGVEELARMVSTGFDDIRRGLDVVERVKHLESDVRQIKEALHISA